MLRFGSRYDWRSIQTTHRNGTSTDKTWYAPKAPLVKECKIVEGLGTIESGVLIGSQGELFLADGGHNVLDFATGKRQVNVASIRTFWRNISDRRAYITARGAEFHHIIFPDKQSVLVDNFITPTPICLGQLYIDSFPPDIEDNRSKVFYPKEVLKSENARVFLKTDTHLTDCGSVIVAAAIVEQVVGRPQSELLADIRRNINITKSHCGDLGKKLSPPASSDEVFLGIREKNLWLHNGVSGGNNGIIDIRMNEEAPFAERVLLSLIHI